MTDRSTDHWLGRHYDAADHVHGPIAFLNPTTRFQSLHPPPKGAPPDDTPPPRPSPQDAAQTDEDDDDAETPQPSPRSSPASAGYTGVYTVWRSRDNRKGRHALHLTPSHAARLASPSSPKRTDTLSAAVAGIARMFVRWPVWDVSYDVAVIFTLGSVCVLLTTTPSLLLFFLVTTAALRLPFLTLDGCVSLPPPPLLSLFLFFFFNLFQSRS